MKKFAFLIAFALTFLLGSTAAFAGDMMNMDGPSYGDGSQQSGSGSNETPRRNVVIQNFAFTPATITVPADTFVVWTNRDSVEHTVTGDGTVGPSSGTLNPGQQYGYPFNKPGTYTYHCMIHPNMHGTVIVTPTSTSGSGKTTPPATGGNQPSYPSSPSGNAPSSNVPSGNAGTSTNGAPSAQATANANSSSTNNTYNNYYANGKQSAQTSAPAATAAPAQQPAPSATPATATPTYGGNSMPTSMPNTGAAGAVAVFVLATAAGSGAYYWYARRRALGT